MKITLHGLAEHRRRQPAEPLSQQQRVDRLSSRSSSSEGLGGTSEPASRPAARLPVPGIAIDPRWTATEGGKGWGEQRENAVASAAAISVNAVVF